MSKSKIEVFPRGQFDFVPLSDGPGESRIARVVTDAQYDTLGSGIAEFSQTMAEPVCPVASQF